MGPVTVLFRVLFPHVDASTAWFGWGRIIYVSIYNCWKNSFPANAILICQVLSTAEGINREGLIVL